MSVNGHEFAATDTDLGVKVLLTIVEKLSTLTVDPDRRDLNPAAYQSLATRLSEVDHPLLGMPKRISPPSSEPFWYSSHASEGTPLSVTLIIGGPWRGSRRAAHL